MGIAEVSEKRSRCGALVSGEPCAGMARFGIVAKQAAKIAKALLKAKFNAGNVVVEDFCIGARK
jgi:hypothetical protein